MPSSAGGSLAWRTWEHNQSVMSEMSKEPKVRWGFVFRANGAAAVGPQFGGRHLKKQTGP